MQLWWVAVLGVVCCPWGCAGESISLREAGDRSGSTGADAKTGPKTGMGGASGAGAGAGRGHGSGGTARRGGGSGPGGGAGLAIGDAGAGVTDGGGGVFGGNAAGADNGGGGDRAGTGGLVDPGSAGEGGADSVPEGCEPTWSTEGGVELASQADLEQLRGAARVNGDLKLTGDIADLSALRCLTRVEGFLDIEEAPQLESLDGLENLAQVGDLFIWSDAELRRIELSSLVSSNVNFLGNPLLEAVSLPALEQTDDVRIVDNPVLVELDLSALEHTSVLSLDDLPALVDLHGLRSLRRVGSGFFRIRGVGVSSLAGLENLREIGTFYLTNDPVLTNLDALAKVSDVYELFIGELDSIETLEGLGLPSILDDVALYDCPKLRNLGNLAKVTNARVSLERLGIENLDGLAALESGSRLSIYENEALTTLTGMSSIQRFGVLTVVGNPKLQSLAGLEAFAELDGLHVMNHASLTSLAGLANLQVVHDFFMITDNPNLPTCEVEALRSRTADGGVEVTISGNDDDSVCAP